MSLKSLNTVSTHKYVQTWPEKKKHIQPFRGYFDPLSQRENSIKNKIWNGF